MSFKSGRAVTFWSWGLKGSKLSRLSASTSKPLGKMALRSSSPFRSSIFSAQNFSGRWPWRVT